MSYKTRFYLEKRKGLKEFPVRVSFTFGNQRVMTTTGLKSTIEQWSVKQQNFKPSASNAAALNEILKGIEKKIEMQQFRNKNFLSNSDGILKKRGIVDAVCKLQVLIHYFRNTYLLSLISWFCPECLSRDSLI